MNWKNKTLKREYALTLMLVLVYTIASGNVPMVTVIIFPILAYVAAVSGVHMLFNGGKFLDTQGK